MIWLKGLSKISESVIEFSLGTLSHSNGSIKQNDWFRPSESWDLIKKDLLNAILPPEELLLDFRPATICLSSLSLDGNSVRIQRAGRRACECLRTGWLCSGWSFRRDRPNPPARENGSPASTALNPHSWEILLPRLSLELWLRTDLAGGGKGEKESKEKKKPEKEERLFLLWFSELNCLPETALSARAGGQEEDVLPKRRSGRQNLSFGSSKLLDWHISSSIFDSSSPPTRSLPSLLYHIASHLKLPFAPCPVSSHVPLPSPPSQFVWPIHDKPGTFSWAWSSFSCRGN